MDLTPGTPALVIGGDARAAAQVASLLSAGAVVTVVAPTATASIEDLADRGLITWLAREADMTDVHRRRHRPHGPRRSHQLPTASSTAAS